MDSKQADYESDHRAEDWLDIPVKRPSACHCFGPCEAGGSCPGPDECPMCADGDDA